MKKVMARDAAEDQPALRARQEEELEALLAHMNAKYPGWDAPAPPPEYPPTLKGCQKLAVRLRAQMTAVGASKRTRADFREQLDRLEAHISEAFPS